MINRRCSAPHHFLNSAEPVLSTATGAPRVEGWQLVVIASAAKRSLFAKEIASSPAAPRNDRFFPNLTPVLS
jgi:hypothetical protein